MAADKLENASAQVRPQRAELSEKLVLHKARCASLVAVRNLNLWGSNLHDISVIAKCSNVEVVSLSVNQVHSLACFASCKALQELYLRKNQVAQLEELTHLIDLPRLRVLWLADNPCASTPSYRQVVLRCLPKLTKLDNVDVTQEERTQADDVALPEALAVALEAQAAQAAQAQQVPRKAAATQDKKAQSTSFQPALPQSKPTAPPQPSRVNSTASDRSAAPGSSNVLYAVMALLSELDEQHLAIVREDCDARLQASGK